LGRSDASTLPHFFAPQNVWVGTRNESKQAKQEVTSMKTKSNSRSAFSIRASCLVSHFAQPGVPPRLRCVKQISRIKERCVNLLTLVSKDRLIALFAAILSLLIFGEAGAKTALFVVGDTTLSADDNALKNRLDYYYTVSVIDDSAVADTSKNLIVISASVDPIVVGTKYKFTSKGVLVMSLSFSTTWG